MPAFAYLELSDRLACQGTPAVYGVLHPDDLNSASDVQAVEDQESLTFKYSRLDAEGAVRPITAQMRAGRVITVVWDDDSFDEWRVGPVVQGRGEAGLITVTCVPLWNDLVERADSSTGKGWVSDLSSGERNFDYEITQRTPTTILSTYVIPNCPTWVTLGTVDPTYVIQSLTVSRMTPGALALAVRDALRSVDVTCEVRLRRNGETDYKLDLVTQIGSSATTPVFHPSNALLSLQQKTDPTLQATRVLVKGNTSPDGLPGRWGIARWKGTVSGTTITLSDRNGGSSPIAFDNQFVGNYLLRVKTGRTFAITSSSASAGTVTCSGGVSTSATDEDFEFRLTEPLTNTRTTTTRYAVSAVPDGTHITCGVSVPIVADNQYADWYAKVWSAAAAGTVITTTRISATVAATDVLTVASSAGVNNTHYVEFIQLDGAGEIPSAVDHPVYSAADPTGYGIKAAELSKSMLGVTQLVPNGWMRTWTNSANPPDGWTLAGTGASLAMTQNTSAAFTRYGGLSWRFTSGAANHPIARTALAYPNNTDGLTQVSVRCWVYYSSFPFTNVGGFRGSSKLTLYAAKGDGTNGTTLGSVIIAPLGYSAFSSGFTEVGTGYWIELKIEGITLSTSGNPASAGVCAPFGVVAEFDVQGGVTSDIYDGYVDVIEVYPFSTCPNDDFEFGDATALAQSGNNQLRTVASPPLFYSFTVRDLERAFPTEYARLALTLGGNVRAADVEYGIDTTVRLLRRDRDLLDPSKTALTLANRPTLLTTAQVAEAANTEQAIADAALTGGGTTNGFFAPTTATTLTPGAEFTTPSSGAPTFTFPSLSVASDGASITYVPADPSTTPQTVVTAGTPPSRTRSPIAQSRGSGGIAPLYYPVLSGESGVLDTSYEWGDLRRFGAVCDGVADDTSAFVAAIAAALAVPRISSVFVPPGDFLVTSNIVASVTGATPRGIHIYAHPGTAFIYPSAAVTTCLTLATEANSDGTCNWLTVTGLRIDGTNTTNAVGVLVGENAGDISANITLDDVQVHRFAGGSGVGIRVKNAVMCHYNRVYAARSDTNLHVEGDANLGFPTLQYFNGCSFRDGPGQGVVLVMGHRCVWHQCLFESNQEEGFYCVPGATGDVDNCVISDSWFETNWTGNPSIATKYHLYADGTTGGLGLRLTNVNFEGSTRAIYWKNVKDGVIDNPRVNNAANQVTIDTGCVGSVRNWGYNYTDWPTVATNASPTTFVARDVLQIVAPPSSTAAAGLFVSTGTAPTSPVQGEIWYDGTHFYGRTAGGTKQLDN